MLGNTLFQEESHGNMFKEERPERLSPESMDELRRRMKEAQRQVDP